MQLNHEGEVWKKCCEVWSDPNKELWIDRDNGGVDVYCLIHSEMHLGHFENVENGLPEALG